LPTRLFGFDGGAEAGYERGERSKMAKITMLCFAPGSMKVSAVVLFADKAPKTISLPFRSRPVRRSL
jgi:hypothetical protein